MGREDVEACLDSESRKHYNVLGKQLKNSLSLSLSAFFAHKVEHESKAHNGRSFQRTGTLAFERVYTAK